MPSAKIIEDKKYSILSDYLGRPAQAYNEEGDIVWEAQYDIYGKITKLKGDKTFVPFRQLGQYEDSETPDLYYNRFRFYDAETGLYFSQDPIGLAGNNPNFYGYVHDSNRWADPFGLECKLGFKGSMDDLAKMGKTAKDLPEIKPGTKQWKDAVKEAKEALSEGKNYQVRVPTSTDAKAFTKDVHGNMNRYKAHTQSKADGASKYKKGYEQHQSPERAPMDLQHIKWYNNGSNGHVYYGTPN
ncbi:MAG: RHS repeat-associated core domain-containing protein [Limnohabitans sp.]|nr:RHS repeat-associated core domain-containing protein [Limnohabitans sp.]